MRESAVERTHWDLAAESIVVKIRWFGVAMGYILVQTRTGLHDPWAVRAFLALGAGYAALDLAFWRMGEVILTRWPLSVSLLESVFIALLCYHDTGLESPFRWYYLLSLVCCSLRYRSAVAWWTFGFHCVSLALLAAVSSSWPPGRGAAWGSGWPLTITIMAWVTWASSSLATVSRQAGAQLEVLNGELESARTELERRVQERTDALRASQARVIQQEKMAAFGLLAAGIAHEVGNPLAAVSSLVQMLQRRGPDPYTAAKLELAARQLHRIERTLRELIDFSRPGSTAIARVRLAEVVDEALSIAKYHRGTKQREVDTRIPPSLPPVRAVRDYLTQVVLNLVLNAVDATDQQGHIRIEASLAADGRSIALVVEDNGRGITPADQDRLGQPYFTTKPHGTGLGLFVSRQMLAEFGGSLSFCSEPGTGSVFTIRLPLEPSPAGSSIDRPADENHRGPFAEDVAGEPALVSVTEAEEEPGGWS
jgi:signal transduction histidine kinase